MALVLNGSANTIGGLAVGGVPDNTIDNGCLADDAVGIADLSATGTASSSTFLRGDNAWAAASVAARYFYSWRGSGSNQGITSNTNTKVEWEEVTQSDSAFSTANNKWTATADDAGTWFVQLQISYYTDGNDGNNVMTNIYKNGSAYSGGYTWIWRGTDDVGHLVGQVQGLMTIATNDYIEGYGRMTGGNNEAFFGGDSSGGHKQTSIIGFKL